MAMSALSMMGEGFLSQNPVNRAAAAGMFLGNTGIGALGSYGLGRAYVRWGDDPTWKGKLAKNSPEILGGLGKVLEFALLMWRGPGWASGLTGSLGQVGVNALCLEAGLDVERKNKGIALVKVPEGSRAAIKSGAKADGTYLGALPPAEAGHGLAWDHIREMSQMH